MRSGISGTAAAWHARGRELQLQGDAAGAEQAYRQALELDPAALRSLNNLAVLAMAALQPQQAEAWLQRGLAAVADWDDPAAPLLLNSLCQLRLQQQQPTQALAVARQLVQLAPEAAGWSNLAVAFQACNRLKPALRAQGLALGAPQRDPLQGLWQPLADSAASATRQVQLQNLATMELALDPLGSRGWRLLQARLACTPAHWQPQGGARPWQGLWQGELVPELLLWDEQGYGDAIQCLRWLPLAAQRTQRLRFWVRPELRRLVQQRLALPAHVQLELLRPGAAAWQQGVPHLPLMSLPLALGLSGSAMAGLVPFRRELGGGGHRVAGEPLRLGLVWAAGRKPDAEADRHARSRSLPLAQLMDVLLPLVDQGRVRLQCLQVGEDAREAEAFRAVLEPAPALGDWEATACLMEQLDGLISVDTAAAHLGGSLGLPTLLLLDTPCDWRWGQQGPVTCWYPSVRLLRYRQTGGLGDGLERALAAWL